MIKLTFHVHAFSFFNWFLVQVWSFPLINFNSSNFFLFIIYIFLSSNTKSQIVDRSNSWNKMHKVLYFINEPSEKTKHIIAYYGGRVTGADH